MQLNSAHPPLYEVRARLHGVAESMDRCCCSEKVYQEQLYSSAEAEAAGRVRNGGCNTAISRNRRWCNCKADGGALLLLLLGLNICWPSGATAFNQWLHLAGCQL